MPALTPPALSHRLAAAMQVLIQRDAIDLAEQFSLYGVFRTTDATQLDDYPHWVVDLVTSAEQPVVDTGL